MRTKVSPRCIGVSNRWFRPLTVWTVSYIRITFQTISNPYVLILLTYGPGFHKQVVRFPHSRYDCGLQTSSRIWTTWHGQGDWLTRTQKSFMRWSRILSKHPGLLLLRLWNFIMRRWGLFWRQVVTPPSVILDMNDRDGRDPVFSCTVYVIWQNFLQNQVWTDVDNPQGRAPVLFCFDIRT
jgi:hypothetical protein